MDLDRALTVDIGQWRIGDDMATGAERNLSYMVQNGMVGVEEPVLHIPAESGFPPLNLTNPFATAIKALVEGKDAQMPAFANIPARTWRNGLAERMTRIEAKLDTLIQPGIDYIRLAEALRPIVAQECEAAMRRVLGSLND